MNFLCLLGLHKYESKKPEIVKPCQFGYLYAGFRMTCSKCGKSRKVDIEEFPKVPVIWPKDE